MSQISTLSAQQPFQNKYNISEYALSLLIITGLVLAIIGILAAANVSFLKICTPYWYCFELAALACFAARIAICCKSKSNEPEDISNQQVTNQNRPPEPGPAVGVSQPQIAIFVNQPSVIADPNQLFMNGIKLVYLHNNPTQALPLFQQAWQMGHAVAGLAILDHTAWAGLDVLNTPMDPNYLHSLLQIYGNLAKQKCLEALYFFAYDAFRLNKAQDATLLLLTAEEVEQNPERKKVLSELLATIKNFAGLSSTSQALGIGVFTTNWTMGAKHLLVSAMQERRENWARLAQTS